MRPQAARGGGSGDSRQQEPWDMAGSNPGIDFRCTIASCVLPIPTVESTVTSPYWYSTATVAFAAFGCTIGEG